jgi:hypothetical protein
MKTRDTKASLRNTSARDPGASAAPIPDAQPIRSCWREAIARQLAAVLKKTARGQRTPSLRRISQAVVAEARKGNIYAIEMMFREITVLSSGQNRRPFSQITPDMSYKEAFSVYFENIKRTEPCEE